MKIKMIRQSFISGIDPRPHDPAIVTLLLFYVCMLMLPWYNYVYVRSVDPVCGNVERKCAHHINI